MTHSIYQSLYEGFQDKLNDLPSRIDDYGSELDGKHYEGGRHLAIYFQLNDLDVSQITTENIFSNYKKFTKEIYQKNGQQRRARN